MQNIDHNMVEVCAVYFELMSYHCILCFSVVVLLILLLVLCLVSYLNHWFLHIPPVLSAMCWGEIFCFTCHEHLPKWVVMGCLLHAKAASFTCRSSLAAFVKTKISYPFQEWNIFLVVQQADHSFCWLQYCSFSSSLTIRLVIILASVSQLAIMHNQ